MNNQPCMVKLTLTDLNPDELHYYQFIISMNRCDGSCNTAEDPSGRKCVLNKTEDVNLKLFDIIKGYMNQRQLQNISYGSVDMNLMERNVT